MKHTSPKTRVIVVISLVMAGIGLLFLSAGFRKAPAAAGSPHNVHIAFGFHVNLYHSFRHDTNDENGFGQDIRVIRHIIRTLDHYNSIGIPVKGVWDFDNLFSLEEILPAHAEDIISDIKRRVHQNGDEIILMSYNNGLVSAMTREELTTSMARTITNTRGSGVVDIFGKATMVVRPQEMMTSPGNFDIYNALGIRHVALYYSATPFDAFRMFVRELSPVEAYNPVRYNHPQTGETSIIIPSYHAGDLVEHVNLKHWVKKLHRMQVEGAIDRDVLIFLNFDADSEFWSGVELPWYLDWLPNTGGLAQLADMVADLDCVSFTTVGEYIENHPPVGSVYFSQDTADGSFNGYHSWAEKSYTSDFWAHIVRNRRASVMAELLSFLPGIGSLPVVLESLKTTSFETRLRALSTTNFGLAVPFLARQREVMVKDIARELDRYSQRIENIVDEAGLRYLVETPSPPGMDPYGEPVDRFLVLDPIQSLTERRRNITLSTSIPRGQGLMVSDSAGNLFPVLAHRMAAGGGNGPKTVITLEGALADGAYFLYRQPTVDHRRPCAVKPITVDKHMLKNEAITVRLSENGHVQDVTAAGIRVLDPGSLVPFIRYDGRRLVPDQLKVTVLEDGANGSAAIRMRGRWDGPPGVTRRPGWIDYRLRLVQGTPYLFIEGEVQYPETYRPDLINTEKPMLARKIDRLWQAVGPIELRFTQRASREQPVVVQKRNFLEKETAYVVDYYRHAPENSDLDSINNHITAEYISVIAGGRGMALAMDTTIQANFAFCPFKINHESATGAFAVLANPFGTYDGQQHVPPTRGNRLGYETTMLSGPQFNSAGPTFNGYKSRFAVMVAFFEGDGIPGNIKEDLIGYARPPAVIMAGNEAETVAVPTQDDHPPAGLLALPYNDGAVFHWEKTSDDTDINYRLVFKDVDETFTRKIETRETTLFVQDVPIEDDTVYTATVAKIGSDGEAKVSPEIHFTLNGDTTPFHAIVPAGLKAKIIWANLTAWFEHKIM